MTKLLLTVSSVFALSLSAFAADPIQQAPSATQGSQSVNSPAASETIRREESSSVIKRKQMSEEEAQRAKEDARNSGKNSVPPVTR